MWSQLLPLSTRCLVIPEAISRALVILLLWVLLWLLMTAYASDAQAQECTNATGLSQGLVAPCSGVLFPNFWAIKAVNCIDVDLPMEKTKHNECNQVMQIKQATWLEKETAYKKQIFDLEELAREAAQIERPWYSSKWVWFTAGAMLSTTIIYIAR